MNPFAERKQLAKAYQPANMERARVSFASTRADLQRYLHDLVNEMETRMANAGFADMLYGMARLWRYSMFNQYFIRMQMRTATAVAGRKQWEKRGRTVNTDRNCWPWTLRIAPTNEVCTSALFYPTSR